MQQVQRQNKEARQIGDHTLREEVKGGTKKWKEVEGNRGKYVVQAKDATGGGGEGSGGTRTNLRDGDLGVERDIETPKEGGGRKRGGEREGERQDEREEIRVGAGVRAVTSTSAFDGIESVEISRIATVHIALLLETKKVLGGGA